MKKLLFIDRDGTLIREPEDEQIDSFDKLAFLPDVFYSLRRIRQLTDYEFVMVSNQDGLGTASFPEETFWPVQNFILQTLAGEGITFSAVHIDRHFPDDNAPTRKPGTAMLTSYMDGSYDLAHSYVIGDRETDAQLARNLGCRSILLRNGVTWRDVASCIIGGERTAEVHRVTRETDVFVRIGLEGKGICQVNTGLHFFDHMLEQLAHHGAMDVEIKVNGDLAVDEHHTMEDTAIVLGECISRCLGDKRGIRRYGFVLPMDDSLCQVAIDFGGRPWLVWNVDFQRERIGDVPTEMFYHFFKSFSDAAKINLNIRAEGQNEHHKIEAVFKAFARAMRMAVEQDFDHFVLPSSKGSL